MFVFVFFCSLFLLQLLLKPLQEHRGQMLPLLHIFSMFFRHFVLWGFCGCFLLLAGALLAKALKGRPNFEADDQSALVYLLVTQTDEWADKVFLENSYYLHGYWAILVDHYEEMMEKYHPGLGDHRWPFVTHFVGCKPCSKVGDYSADRCLTQMERAFNFGDNQILEMLGFKHRSLISKKVKRVRNDTDDPLQLKAELLLSQAAASTTSNGPKLPTVKPQSLSL